MVELRAELMHADASSRVVRVSAHQGERLLGSCLGEAPDAEQAEDRAAARLRARLGLDAQGVVGQGSGDEAGVAGVPSLPLLSPPNAGDPIPGMDNRTVVGSPAAQPSPPAGQPSPPAGGDALTQAGTMAGATAPRRSSGPKSPQPRTASTEASPALPAATDQPPAVVAANSPDQLSLTGTQDPWAGAAETHEPRATPARSPRSEASAVETSEPREPAQAAAASSPAQAPPKAEPNQAKLEQAGLEQAGLDRAEPPQAPPPDPDDWSQELAGLELQLRRLAWGREQEAVFLERAFGHPSRSRLTTYGDLLAYLRALEGLEAGADPASAPVPLRRRDLVRVGDELMVALGWSAEQGRQFLAEHLGPSSRQRLSDAELLQFNMLLEAELLQLEPVVAESSPSQPDAQSQPT